MNNKMRRIDRQLSEEETINIFEEAEYGVLSVVDENNMPYGVPMSFALYGNNIYFHCSIAKGKKISCMEYCKNASLTVVQNTQLLPEQFSTLYMSGIAYGTIEVVEDEKEKRKGMEAILHKYSPDYIEKGMNYIERAIDKVNVLKFEIKKMTGKGRKAK